MLRAGIRYIKNRNILEEEMTTTKKFVSLLLVMAMLLTPASAFAASTTKGNYSAYNTPEDTDFAYWNGKAMVKGSGTVANEVKWMQAFLNSLISKGYIAASYIEEDSSFGPATAALCGQYQAIAGLSVDKSFGPASIKRAKEIIKGTYKIKTEPTRVEFVNELKSGYIADAEKSYSDILRFHNIACEVFGSREFIKTLGIGIGSSVSGFATAPEAVATDPYLILRISTLEIARYAMLRTKVAADKVISYKNQSLTYTSSIDFLNAYKDYAYWYMLARNILLPIIDEYAQYSNASMITKVNFLVGELASGALDGALGGLKNVTDPSKLASTLLKIQTGGGHIEELVNQSKPYIPAFKQAAALANGYAEVIAKVKTLK